MPIHNQLFIKKDKTLDSSALTIQGPLIHVAISVPPSLEKYLAENNQPIPNPITGIGLIDTGASITCVDQEVITKLDVPAVGYTDVFTPSGGERQNTHPAKIAFPGTNLPEINFNAVLASKLKAQKIIALLGRDVLRHFMLVYNGTLGIFTVAF